MFLNHLTGKSDPVIHVVVLSEWKLVP